MGGVRETVTGVFRARHHVGHSRCRGVGCARDRAKIIRRGKEAGGGTDGEIENRQAQGACLLRVGGAVSVMCLRGERPPPPPASTPSIGSSHSLSKKRGLGRGLMSGRSQACAFLVLIAVFLPGVCPASSSQPPPRLGGGGRWGLEGHILFVPQLLLAMGRRKAVVGQLLELRGAASRHSDGREDKRDSSQRLRQHRAVPSTTFGGLGNQSPAPPPPLVGPPLPMGSPRSTTMGEVHGVNQWGGEAWHGEQNGPALLAGQIGKWQKLRARKDGAVKIKCGMCIVPPVEIWDQIQVTCLPHGPWAAAPAGPGCRDATTLQSPVVLSVAWFGVTC